MNVLEAKAKAVAGAVVTAIVSYVGLAIIQGQILTAHGLELAAAGAVLTFLGVHQAPKNKERAPKRRVRADAGLVAQTVVLWLAIAVLALILILLLIHHVHVR